MKAGLHSDIVVQYWSMIASKNELMPTQNTGKDVKELQYPYIGDGEII